MSGAIKLATGLFTAASGGIWLYVIVFAAGATGGVAGTWWVAHQHAVAVEAQRDAALALLKGASDQRDALAASINDYKARITQDTDLLNQQSAAFEAQRADLLRANADNESLKQRTRQAEEARDTEAAEIEAEAKAHPEQFVVIGPNVKARIPDLWK